MKKLSNKRFKGSRPVKDKEGKLILQEKQQLERWKEFFSELLNRVTGDNDGQEEDVNQAIGEEDNRISIAPPSRGEIIKAVKELKNGKSPGIDNIPPEVLKANPEATADILHRLLKQIWEEEAVPTEWKRGLLVKIPKKGDLTVCNNWRGITLLSVPSKVLTRIVLNRIKGVIESKLRREQAGFRKDCACVDMINTLRIILEQSNEFQSPLYLTFVDFEKAFDSISRKSMWTALKEFGLPQKVINIIKATYEGYECQVIHEGKLTDSFRIRTGVRQGCLLSPILFLMVLDKVMVQVNRRPRGLQWGLIDRLEDIDYADDLCLLCHKLSDMKDKLTELTTEGQKVGLKINVKKTKEMRINHRSQEELFVEDKKVEQVSEFQYLGSVVSATGGTEEDVDLRIRKAKGIFAQLHPIWRTHQLRRKTKLKIFDSNVKSVLLYGCQTWKITKPIVNKIQVFINKCLRQILKIYWPNTISNAELWQRCNQTPIGETIKKRKYGWIGHTLRRPGNNISRQALDWNPQGKRKRGRPKQTWRRTVEREIQEEGKTWGELKCLAQNRVRWRSFVAALRPPGIKGNKSSKSMIDTHLDTMGPSLR